MDGIERRFLDGLPVDQVGLERAVSVCLAAADGEAGEPLRVITLNPEMVMRARKDDALARSFAGSTLVVADGAGIIAAGRLRGWRGITRVPGIELCERLIAEASARGLPVFFYGGEPGVAETAAANLRRRYPGLTVAGTAHGYLPEAEAEALPARIAATRARLLFVALGAGRQEAWLARHLEAAGARVGMGVGGSLDVFAGRTRRAPALFRRLGLEWAYRLARQPSRWRRLLVLPGFVLLALLPGTGRRRRVK
ncbi:MAG: WecB/TagA/CpsF family glycosyltransferase [Patescibacteria group bacterium]